MTTEAHLRGIEFAAKQWPKAELAWLRRLGDISPAEAVFMLELVGEFDAMPAQRQPGAEPARVSVTDLALEVLQFSNRPGGGS